MIRVSGKHKIQWKIEAVVYIASFSTPEPQMSNDYLEYECSLLKSQPLQDRNKR